MSQSIENEVYKKGDFESFYNLKNSFIKEIKNFSNYNNEKFHDNDIFNFNQNSMPIYVYPEMPIININDNKNSFGSFKNINISFNEEEKGEMPINDVDQKMDENCLLDSNNQDSLNNKNIISKKNNKTNLEILFEKNVNKNILSSINSGMSNINDSFINKQLIDIDSTLFFLNKNEVKNVFKQQDTDLSQKFDKNEKLLNNNKEIKNSNSPKIKNKKGNIKVRYTSYNKENRNKQIIKKFLENKDLNNDKHFEKEIKQSNGNNAISTNSNSKYLTTYENSAINNTLNDEYFNEHKKTQLRLNKDKKSGKISKSKKRNYPPNNGIKCKQFSLKKCGSINKKINNSKKELNIHSFNLDIKNNKIKNKGKKSFSNKKKRNNVNKFLDDSIEENYQKNQKINNIIYSQRRTDLSVKRIIKNNNLFRNHRNIKSMKNILKNKLNYNDNSIYKENIIPNSQISRISDNYQIRANFSYLNRSNSYRYFNC